MNLIKSNYLAIFIILLLSTTSATLSAQSVLKKELTNKLLADLNRLHPNALDINIAFNLPNTQKKYASCEKIDYPTPQKITPGGRITLRLSCNSPKWSTYITIKTNIYYPVVSSISHIQRGEKLSLDHIQLQKRDITKSHQRYFSSIKSVIGMQAKRAIKASTIITSNMLETPIAVHKDDNVIIQASASGLSITTIGTALQNGKTGKQIKVKNNRSGRIIRAYVTGIGRVSTTPPLK